MWDLIYLDRERIQAVAAELGVDVEEGTSRAGLTEMLRKVKGAMGGKMVTVGAGFDFAGWAPGVFRDGQFVEVRTVGGGEEGRGMVRLLDYPWLSSVMETLPRILKVSQRA